MPISRRARRICGCRWSEGQALVRGLLGRVSGLCQPIYVVDIPGGHGKAPAGPAYWRREGDHWRVEDWRGKSHAYADPLPPANKRESNEL